jgi:hypothetical protein
MGYITGFIKRYGQPCTILRSPQVNSWVSMIALTNRGWDNSDMYREGLILADSGLSGGELFTVGNDCFLARSVVLDQQSEELSFKASRINADLVHLRSLVSSDSFGNITQTWQTVNALVRASAQMVSAAMLEKEPGLLPNTKWVFVMPSSAGVQVGDRLCLDSTLCQVDAIDSLRLPGVLWVQCSDDQRGT